MTKQERINHLRSLAASLSAALAEWDTGVWTEESEEKILTEARGYTLELKKAVNSALFKACGHSVS